ncbi:unnamed protein product [Durusdinium trenchii]|uniref:Uncharacterized protein n=2 Tax=Durusdinium trenchii TaxID=1381693 RepID=A0ABP0N567_9DINO
MLATMSPPANRLPELSGRTAADVASGHVTAWSKQGSQRDESGMKAGFRNPRTQAAAVAMTQLHINGVGPARLVQVIQAWENPYDKHEKFLRLKLGETLKLTHPELNIDGLGLFGGKKYDGMDGPAGWFPSKCVSPIREPHVRGQDADLAGGRGLCKFEDDWDTYTDPATMQKWYHRRSTEEYFFERNPTGWKMYFTDKHQTERRWWYHEADNRYFFEKYETVG